MRNRLVRFELDGDVYYYRKTFDAGEDPAEGIEVYDDRKESLFFWPYHGYPGIGEIKERLRLEFVGVC